MEPTLHTGDVVYVNKLLMGGRIYTRFDFKEPRLHCFRMPGLRNPEVGDLIIYNYPEGWEEGKIGFRINQVYCKRCIGCPGDSISIHSGYYRNNRIAETHIPIETQNQLSSLSLEAMEEQHIARLAYHFAQPGIWTIQEFGPLYIPTKGDTIILDSLNVCLYGKEIEYETGVKPSSGGQYIFKNDWYFLAGDNVLNSRDSRYLGLVPESFFIGIVCAHTSNL